MCGMIGFESEIPDLISVGERFSLTIPRVEYFEVQEISDFLPYTEIAQYKILLCMRNKCNLILTFQYP